jgi:hypothetical protein
MTERAGAGAKFDKELETEGWGCKGTELGGRFRADDAETGVKKFGRH